jgi:uncharacterized protein (DUF2147 family)
MRICLIVLLVLAASRAWAQPTILGSWLTEDRGGVVTLRPCSAGVCGTVDGVTAFQPNGGPPLDYRGQSRCHLQIVPDLHQDDPGHWSGHITNPDDGKTYNIKISLDERGRLAMRGYIGIPLLGRTTLWSRFNGRLTPDCHIQPG